MVRVMGTAAPRLTWLPMPNGRRVASRTPNRSRPARATAAEAFLISKKSPAISPDASLCLEVVGTSRESSMPMLQPLCVGRPERYGANIQAIASRKSAPAVFGAARNPNAPSAGMARINAPEEPARRDWWRAVNGDRRGCHLWIEQQRLRRSHRIARRPPALVRPDRRRPRQRGQFASNSRLSLNAAPQRTSRLPRVGGIKRIHVRRIAHVKARCLHAFLQTRESPIQVCHVGILHLVIQRPP